MVVKELYVKYSENMKLIGENENINWYCLSQDNLIIVLKLKCVYP